MVAVYVPSKKVGIFAHIMLPGKSPEKNISEKTKYAFDAVEKIIKILNDWSVENKDVEVCLVGGSQCFGKRG